ncbi:bifunctional oligoribonuclease/PAP phosphatase NrnA [bacterium]|nr:MAG: bifunctional oligoribonuclease/PAP phosphatase NrnA [bacterium]
MQTFIESILQHKKIGVFTHIRPDGDAIGSLVGASIWLSKFGIKAHAFNDDAIPTNLAWLMNFYPIQKPTQELVDSCEAYLVLDGNAASRFGVFGEHIYASGKPLYMIDHHPNPEGKYTEMISQTSACSTAELVFHLYMNTNMDLLERESAMAIYTGLVTDTGSFRFDSVTPDVHTVASELLRRGRFTPPEIYEKVYDNKNANQIQLLGKALTTVEAPGKAKIGIIKITDEMLSSTQTTYADTEGFVAYALSLQGVDAAVLFAEMNGKIKLSLRSKRGIDCNVWARFYNGGGHVKAAGAWFEGTIDEAVKDVITKGYELYEA